MRCFLAVEIPAAIQDAIQEATASARARLGSNLVRWVPGHNVHLTLKFLGDTPPSTLELIKNVMTAEVPRFVPFDLVVRDFGAFPNKERPRVLWVGLYGPRALESLQRQLDEATARLGYSPDHRGFSPHLTIGRVRQNVPAASMQMICEQVDNTRVGDLGTLRVEAVHLFKSDLQPTGSKYTKLFATRLEVAPK
jgi:2'-5' RNA ligase